MLRTRRKRTAERLLLKLEDEWALGEFDPWAPPEPPEQEGDEYVFTSHRGGRIDPPDYLSWAFMTFRRRAELPEHFSFHSTRHTFGTWLAERGVPVTVIQSLMGHSSVTTTERYMSTRVDVAEQWVGRALK